MYIIVAELFGIITYAGTDFYVCSLWWQREMCVNTFAQDRTGKCSGYPAIFSRKPNALTAMPPRHTAKHNSLLCIAKQIKLQLTIQHNIFTIAWADIR